MNPDMLAPVDSKEGQTDLANARRFVERFGQDVLYCCAWKKWLVWDGCRWKLDDTERIRRMAFKVSDELFSEARQSESKSGALHAYRTGGKPGIDSMLSLAGSLVPVSPDDLDQDPWLINCPNGTVDLRTGELLKHARSDMLTPMCPTQYKPESEAPIWRQTLFDVFQSAALVDYWQRLLGYVACGVVTEHVLPVLFGSGSNGKTTILEAWMDTLGPDYCTTQPADFLLQTRGDNHPTAIANLKGKRLAVCSETGEDRRLNEPFVKELTGGGTLSARRMREDLWQFSPTHTLMLVTNHKPKVSGTDGGIWRRLKLIPFNRVFNEDEQNKDLASDLRVDHPGILNWTVQGCRLWRDKGLAPPREVAEATACYRTDEDVLGAFIAERCNTGIQHFKAKSSQLYKDYCEWCTETGERALSQTKFSTKLKARGYETIRNNGTWFVGIGLQADGRHGQV